MKEVYVFADETGDLGYTSSSSRYFGFGTLSVEENFPLILWNGFKLRCALENSGYQLKEGFHAKVDKFAIKKEMYGLISNMNVKFDFTFLNKDNAYPSVKDKGELGLYKLAWYLHFKYLAEKYLYEDVRLVVVVADIQTKAKKHDLRAALDEVALQFPGIQTSLFVWKSQTSWGLQLADYGTWSAQRFLTYGECVFWDSAISKLTRSYFKPWG
jgi:hypothetical protein